MKGQRTLPEVTLAWRVIMKVADERPLPAPKAVKVTTWVKHSLLENCLFKVPGRRMLEHLILRFN